MPSRLYNDRMIEDPPRNPGDDTYVDALARWIDAHKPRTVLMLRDPAHTLSDRVTLQLADAEVTHLAAVSDCLDKLGPRIFDAAIVVCALEALPKAQASTILGRLRDVHARRLMLVVRIGDRWPGLVSHWERNDLFAHGLRCIGRYGETDAPIHLYRFDLYDYKSVPDWLNAKNWAHPDLWDKHRW